MLLPMMGFTFLLMLTGGLICLFSQGDGRLAYLASRIGRALLFAGVGAFGLSMVLAGLGDATFDWYGAASGLGFFGGYIGGGLGGALIGWKKASHQTM